MSVIVPERSLDCLSSDFRQLVDRVLAQLVERGALVLIVQTQRTLAQHAQNLANGTSSARLSKHLPRKLRGILAEPDAVDAIDLCPYDVYQRVGPDRLAWTDDAAFAVIGEVAERYARLRWGGRWQKPHDPGHLELLFDGERYDDIPPSAAAFARYGRHA